MTLHPNTELNQLTHVGQESMAGAGDAAKEFLEQEKERLEKRRRNLEVQLKSIIDHHAASKDTLTKILNTEKDALHQKILDRRAKFKARRIASKAATKVVPNTPQRASDDPTSMERRPSQQKKNKNKNKNKKVQFHNEQAKGAWTKATEMTSHESITNIHSMMNAINLQTSMVEMTTNMLFELIGYYGHGEEQLDQKIQLFITTQVKEHGVDVPRDAEGNTLLIAAVRFHNIGAAKYIMSIGQADPSCHNNEGATALHYAAAAGDMPMITVLLKRHRDAVNFVGRRDARGLTAAAYAATNGHTNIVDELGGIGKTLLFVGYDLFFFIHLFFYSSFFT